jgi:hypothetical protein
MSAVAPPSAAEIRPVVVELFTSQGCSSCPPADKLLGELAAREGVVALGFHINYWDRLGWKDPLSNPDSTNRQKAYAKRFAGRIYTPQIVIDGTSEVVGTDRAAVLAAMRATGHEAVAPISIAADRGSIAIGANAGHAAAKGNILLVRFVQKRTTHISGGENSGRTVEDVNGVTALTALGTWEGLPRRFAIQPPGPDEGIAVLVQAADGTMLGAALAKGAPSDNTAKPSAHSPKG